MHRLTNKIDAGIVTRSKKNTTSDKKKENDNLLNIMRGKRKANSPLNGKIVKRNAFSDINNTEVKKALVKEQPKKVKAELKELPSVKTLKKPAQNQSHALKPIQVQNIALPPPHLPVNRRYTRSYLKEEIRASVRQETRQTAEQKTRTAVKRETIATAKEEPRAAGKRQTKALVKPEPRATVKPETRETQNGTRVPPKKKEASRRSKGNKENVLTVKKRLSEEFDKSLYSTALEELTESSRRSSARLSKCSTKKVENNDKSEEFVSAKKTRSFDIYQIPKGVVDFDKANLDDHTQVSEYAMDIFVYYREIEKNFTVDDYMARQVYISTKMRSLLVDWMVEIQESFELNHETLYLGVKLVDLYLSKVIVVKDMLQLLGAAAMFLACKFDERIPPLVDDFLYICDGAYTRRDLLKMEITVLRVIGVNLGIPVSYRFLRRYARCGNITMPVLTLARYILELSLMEYAAATLCPSLIAAAALYLSLKMKNFPGWTPALEFYTGYKVEELKGTVLLLNEMMHKALKCELVTIKNKYSHKIFFEVAKTPVLCDDDLF